jgi:hypothetical protein
MAVESPHVWLIDKLAKNFPQLRVYTYGYSPSIQAQSAREDTYEFADTFVRLMRRMRSDSNVCTSALIDTCANRVEYRQASVRRVPVIYLAHSLGGLLFKEVCLGCTTSRTPYPS